MNSQPSKPNDAIIVYCDELCKSSICNSQELNLLNRDIDGLEANITIEFNKFVRNPENLSPRILDLLRIAAYVYCADRLINRGERDSLNNTAWSRAFEFHIPVSDIAFWSDGKVSTKMSEALAFMTGDRRFNFSFTKASLSPVNTDNQQLSLFSTEYLGQFKGSMIIMIENYVLLVIRQIIVPSEHKMLLQNIYEINIPTEPFNMALNAIIRRPLQAEKKLSGRGCFCFRR